jgi:hypothetical protein
MLAYITPEEAELLKSQGGSGKPHADTGIPSFEDEGGYGFTEDTAYDIGNVRAEPPPQVFSQPDYSQQAVSGAAPSSAAASAPVDYSVYTRGMSAEPAAPAVAETPYMPTGAFPAGAFAPPEGGAGLGYKPYQIDTTPEKGIMERLTEATGMSKETLSRLGLAAGGSLYGAYQSKKAAEQGQAAKREQQALAAPYKQKGAELQRAAQAGELTPVGQQQLQAVQAQAAQQATARGGVGTMQSQAQVEAFRQQLLQQQYDYGLKLSGIGDNIALGAIKTGLEADRYVQNLSNSFYTNMANIAAGLPTQAPQQRTA